MAALLFLAWLAHDAKLNASTRDWIQKLIVCLLVVVVQPLRLIEDTRYHVS